MEEKESEMEGKIQLRDTAREWNRERDAGTEGKAQMHKEPLQEEVTEGCLGERDREIAKLFTNKTSSQPIVPGRHYRGGRGIFSKVKRLLLG